MCVKGTILKIFSLTNLIVLAWLITSGCETGRPRLSPGKATGEDILCGYTVERVRVIGLTEMDWDPQGESEMMLKVYLELLDFAGSSIKSPCKLQFELYQFVPRSAKPKGKRLDFWPDLDLIDRDENNRYWQDYLRAYRFDLPMSFEPSTSATYILEVTCHTGAGKRLSYTHQIKYSQ